VIVSLPHKFTPRDYQSDVFDAFFKQGKKRIAIVWPRRHGKDKTCLQIMIAAAMQRVGTYFYLFPQQNTVRKAIWRGMDQDGLKFLDHIPHEIIKKRSESEMYIELINGSIIQLGGADSYDAMMGTNPVGIVFSEYSIQAPDAWHFMRPILKENNGWALFPYTPRGKNHGYDLFKTAKNNDSWFATTITVDDAKKSDGTSVITKEMIDEELADGMPQELIEQEYYCSFDAALAGAYYAKEIKRSADEDRIKSFDILPNHAVYTFWDIGNSDATAIWLMQPVDKELRLIYYIEDNFQPPEFYAKKLTELQKKYNFVYAKHFLPFDAFNKIFALGGKATVDVLKMHGIRPEMTPKVSIIEGISATRYLFDRLVFHKEHCEHGIEAIKSYRSEYKEKDKVYAKRPKHDWSSHCADALRYLSVSWKDRYTNDKQVHVAKYQKWEYRL
jgi:hypothetical protein